MKKSLAFTTVEVIISIVIFAVIIGIVFIVIDPTTQASDSRDARRRSEVASILNALLKFQVDHEGQLPAGLDKNENTAQVIGTANDCATSCGVIATEKACLDLQPALVDLDYLNYLPSDPETGNASNTDYFVNLLKGGRIMVGVCDPETVKRISVTR